MYGGNRNRVMYAPNIQPILDLNGEEHYNHVSTTMNHFFEKLFLVGDLMNTPTEKR